MKIVTAEEMREIDRKTIEDYGIPGLVLMERAGLAVAAKIREVCVHKKIVVISGSGNNGGDGLAAARNLHNDGWDVKVFLAGEPEELKAEALSEYEAAVRFGVPVRRAADLVKQCLPRGQGTLVVDALLGTGISRPVTGRLSELINMINESGLPVLSVDIPSGVSSDSGQVMGCAVEADFTVTFGLPKRGHLLYPGTGLSGKLFVDDIGFPRGLLDSAAIETELVGKEEVSALVPLRRDYSNKGDYGHVLIVAGSKGKTGAAVMSARACLRAGAGLVTIGIPESLIDVFQSRVTEEMILPLPDKGDGTLSSRASRSVLRFLDKPSHVLAVGPGIGVSEDTVRLVKDLIKNSPSPVVIDADGLNSVSGERNILSKAKSPVILTPHPGEMARLLDSRLFGAGKNTEGVTARISDIEKDRIGKAVSFAGETDTFLVLKGTPTVIASPDGRAYLIPTGNAGMATAGSGDVLTGVISGVLGQSREPLHACIFGAYVHGLSGDIAASGKGQHSLVATDIINALPGAFKAIESC